MKDKERQVEEMAKDLCVYCHEMTEEKECPYNEHEESKQKCWESQLAQAKTLIEQGYRKLPKDSIVLSREEYERLKQVENEKDRLYEIKLDLENQLIEKGWTDYEGADEIEKRVSKETAEKIICLIKSFSYDKEFVKIITRIISKRLGVEIKE